MQLAEPGVSSSGADASLEQRQRDEVLKCLEPAGIRPVAELPEMSDADRCKLSFWNLPEKLEAMREMEPALQARINSMQ